MLQISSLAEGVALSIMKSNDGIVTPAIEADDDEVGKAFFITVKNLSKGIESIASYEGKNNKREFKIRSLDKWYTYFLMDPVFEGIELSDVFFPVLPEPSGAFSKVTFGRNGSLFEVIVVRVDEKGEADEGQDVVHLNIRTGSLFTSLPALEKMKYSVEERLDAQKQWAYFFLLKTLDLRVEGKRFGLNTYDNIFQGSADPAEIAAQLREQRLALGGSANLDGAKKVTFTGKYTNTVKEERAGSIVIPQILKLLSFAWNSINSDETLVYGVYPITKHSYALYIPSLCGLSICAQVNMKSNVDVLKQEFVKLTATKTFAAASPWDGVVSKVTYSGSSGKATSLFSIQQIKDLFLLVKEAEDGIDETLDSVDRSPEITKNARNKGALLKIDGPAMHEKQYCLAMSYLSMNQLRKKLAVEYDRADTRTQIQQGHLVLKSILASLTGYGGARKSTIFDDPNLLDATVCTLFRSAEGVFLRAAAVNEYDNGKFVAFLKKVTAASKKPEYAFNGGLKNIEATARSMRNTAPKNWVHHLVHLVPKGKIEDKLTRLIILLFNPSVFITASGKQVEAGDAARWAERVNALAQYEDILSAGKTLRADIDTYLAAGKEGISSVCSGLAYASLFDNFDAFFTGKFS